MNTVPPKPGKKPKTPSNARVDQLLREGIASAKLGDKDRSRERLRQVVSLDPDNEQGWYWLASVVESNDERKACLDKVVSLNPGNRRAQRMLDQLARVQAAPPELRPLKPLDSTGQPGENLQNQENRPATSSSTDYLLSAMRSRLLVEPDSSSPGAAGSEGSAPPVEGSPEDAEMKRRRRRLYTTVLIGGLVALVMIVVGLLIETNNFRPPLPTEINGLLGVKNPTGTVGQTVARTAAQTQSGGGPVTGQAAAGGTRVAAAGTGAAKGTVLPASGGAATRAATGPATAVVNVITQTPAPTFTPPPSPTKSGVLTGTPLAGPPSGLPGHLMAVSGGYIGVKDINLPLFTIDPADWQLRPVLPGERGEYAVLLPDGQRIIYTHLVSGLNTLQLRIVGLDGVQGIDANVLWGNQPPLSDQQMVSIPRSGTGIVFAASNIVESDNTPDIYYAVADLTSPPQQSEPTATVLPTLTLTVTPNRPTDRPGRVPSRTPTVVITPTPAVTDTPEPIQAHRVTLKDSGYHSWPSISPNGKTIVFANNSRLADLSGTHLYVVSVDGGAPKDLTSSMGGIAETEPEWSPDGTQIVFRAIPKNSPPAPDVTGDLYVMKADGSGKQPLVTGTSNNIRPHWSPDGKYVAFSSDRDGKWEIYVVEVATGTIYQVTQTDKVTLCTSWGP